MHEIKLVARWDHSEATHRSSSAIRDNYISHLCHYVVRNNRTNNPQATFRSIAEVIADSLVGYHRAALVSTTAAGQWRWTPLAALSRCLPLVPTRTVHSTTLRRSVMMFMRFCVLHRRRRQHNQVTNHHFLTSLQGHSPTFKRFQWFLALVAFPFLSTLACAPAILSVRQSVCHTRDNQVY